MTTARDVAAEIRKLAEERILVLDGAWGVLLQNRGLARPTSAASASPTIRATS